MPAMTGTRKSNPQGLPKRVYLSRGWYFYVDMNGKWHKLGKTWNFEAKAKWNEFSSGGTIKGSVGDLIDEYLRLVSPTKAPRTCLDHVDQAVWLKKVFGHMPADCVKPSHVARYLDTRCSKDGKPAPVRANREAALLSSVYSWAMRRGLAEVNPCYGVRRNVEKARTRCPSQEEIEAVNSVAPLAVALTVELAYYTGQRRADLLKLRLADLTEAGIQITQGKTGAKLLIRWSPGLRDCVNAIKALERPVRGLFLICNRRGQPYTDSGFKAMWGKAMDKALKEGLIQERFHFHDIRAAAITAADEANMDAQGLAGHKSRSMTEAYIRSHKTTQTDPAPVSISRREKQSS